MYSEVPDFLMRYKLNNISALILFTNCPSALDMTRKRRSLQTSESLEICGREREKKPFNTE
jgi:hypothetical protein